MKAGDIGAVMSRRRQSLCSSPRGESLGSRLGRICSPHYSRTPSRPRPRRRAFWRVLDVHEWSGSDDVKVREVDFLTVKYLE